MTNKNLLFLLLVSVIGVSVAANAIQPCSGQIGIPSELDGVKDIDGSPVVKTSSKSAPGSERIEDISEVGAPGSEPDREAPLATADGVYTNPEAAPRSRPKRPTLPQFE